MAQKEAHVKLVYIAGPLRASHGWDVTLNIIKAKALALEVWRLGAVCICPHANTDGFGGVLPEQTWMDGDIEILQRCDAVLMGEDWMTSAGAIEERLTAKRAGIPVFLTLDALKAWLAQIPPSDSTPSPAKQGVFVSGTSASIFTPRPPVDHNDGFGHGHVRPRPDGVKARCGGPGLCRQCYREQAAVGTKDWREIKAAGLQWAERVKAINAMLVADCWPPVWMTEGKQP